MLRLSYGFRPLRAFFRLLGGLAAWPKTTAATVAALALAGVLLNARASAPRDYATGTGHRAPRDVPARWARVKTTGYCACGVCCSWHRSLFGLGMPVVSAGPNKGRPKAVGVTASGTRARPGVIAADTNLFAIGTIMYVPGYGWGRVEDTGGAIKGYHIDLYFTAHDTAKQWGVQKKEIKFWRPANQTPRGVRIVEK